jgi:WD40 repeat protein
MSGLREAFDEIVAEIPVYGDLDRAIEQADRERRHRYGVAAGVVAAAAVLAVIVGALLVTRGADNSPQPVGPSPTPTEKNTTIDPVLVNGQIIGAQTHFGVDASHYDWRGYDPVTDTGLFATGSDADRDFDLEGLAVVGPSGPLATLTCAQDLRCSPEDNRLSFAATLGPGADEVTVESGDGTAQVLGYDGKVRRTLDLTATITDGGAVAGLRWSADGSRLAVVIIKYLGGGEDGTVTQAWLLDPDGSNAQLAYSLFLDGISPRTHAGPDFDGEGTIWPASGWGWSPDGRSLILDVWTPGQVWEYGAEVVALHVPPGGPATAQTLYRSNRHFDWAGNVAWSPDGTRIAVRTRLPGSSMHRVTEISADDGSVVAEHPHINDYLIWPRNDD